MALAATAAVALVAVGWWWSRESEREPSAVTPAAALRSDPPSVVLITIDTWRADRLGRASLTPRIDDVVRGGTLFTHAYATVPLTLPSHVSMLSGRLPIGHTVRTNDSGRVPDGLPLITEIFRGAGMATGAFVGAAVLARATGIDRGFDTFDDDVGPTGERRCDAVIDRAAAWLDRQQGSLFLWAHLFDPHLDYDPPEPYRTRFASQPYDGEIAYTDACVGRLLDHLGALDRMDRTIIAIAGDHGEGLGEHGERSHGTQLFESTIHVPLVLRGPRLGGDRGGVGVRVDRPVSAASLGPTLLHMAGLGATLPPMDVASLVGADGALSAPPDPVLIETLYLRQLLGWSPLYAIREAGEKLIDAPRVRRFDVARDPAEATDVSSTDPARTARLQRLLRGGLTAVAQRRVTPAAGAVDEAQRTRLASLGYVTGGTHVEALEPVRGADPIERVALWDRVEQALEASQRGRRGDAERQFAAIMADDPDNALALKFLGAAALERALQRDSASSGLRQAALQQAIAMHERLVALGLHLADAQANLALAYDRAGRAREAEAAARTARALDPAHRGAQVNLATVLWHAGRSQEAGEVLDELLRHDPTHAAARALRDEIARADGAPGPPDATGTPRVHAGADRNDPALFDRLGLAAMRAHDDRGARAAFERAVELAPSDPVRIERLAALLHRTGDRAGARTWFERAAALAPARPTATLSLGILDYEAGQADRARRRLEPIRSDWAGAYVAQCYYGQSLAALGRTAEARDALEACVRAAPAGDPLVDEARRRLARLR